MEDGGEYSGRTVEDAIAQAESDLGVGRDDLDVEVVTQGSRGVFGIGAEPAHIRARRRDAVRVPTGQPETPIRTVTEEPEPETRPRRAAAAAEDGDLPRAASEVLRQLLTIMGFDAEVSVRSTDNPIILAISGSNLGVLIGRRGDNLAALQFMVNLILSKNRRQWPRIVIDVENYRARREESLRSLADRVAYRVRRNGRPFTLEAMPASDRRIIHLALRDNPEIETYSIGEGTARRVVIAPRRTAAVPQHDYTS